MTTKATEFFLTREYFFNSHIPQEDVFITDGEGEVFTLRELFKFVFSNMEDIKNSKSLYNNLPIFPSMEKYIKIIPEEYQYLIDNFAKHLDSVYNTNEYRFPDGHKFWLIPAETRRLIEDIRKHKDLLTTIENEPEMLEKIVGVLSNMIEMLPKEYRFYTLM
jgi:hypothetical protein